MYVGQSRRWTWNSMAINMVGWFVGWFHRNVRDDTSAYLPKLQQLVRCFTEGKRGIQKRRVSAQKRKAKKQGSLIEQKLWTLIEN